MCADFEGMMAEGIVPRDGHLCMLEVWLLLKILSLLLHTCNAATLLLPVNAATLQLEETSGRRGHAWLLSACA